MKRWFILGLVICLAIIAIVLGRLYIDRQSTRPVGRVEVSFYPVDWNLEGHPAVRTARLKMDTTESVRFSIASHQWEGELFLSADWQNVRHETVPSRLLVGKDGRVDVTLILRSSEDTTVDFGIVDSNNKIIEKGKIIFSRPPGG